MWDIGPKYFSKLAEVKSIDVGLGFVLGTFFFVTSSALFWVVTFKETVRKVGALVVGHIEMSWERFVFIYITL